MPISMIDPYAATQSIISGISGLSTLVSTRVYGVPGILPEGYALPAVAWYSLGVVTDLYVPKVTIRIGMKVYADSMATAMTIHRTIHDGLHRKARATAVSPKVISYTAWEEIFSDGFDETINKPFIFSTWVLILGETAHP
jgi:hypothetical protein